jgi:DNA (cytosine-5)-methyltransferase 1
MFLVVARPCALHSSAMKLTALELCAGGGGQAIGLHRAGFECVGAVELDRFACETLRRNSISERVIEQDLRSFCGTPFGGVDLVAGGVPCPPFSKAGKQLGKDDTRDLFPEALRVVREVMPRAVMLENVPGFAEARFQGYRRELQDSLAALGYSTDWRILHASDFDVPQLRPRFLMVGLRPEDMDRFRWPLGRKRPPTVGQALEDLMGGNGWDGAAAWARAANRIAPTVVGGSKLHGGPDLGPTRAKRQWRELCVDGLGIANEAPGKDTPADHVPRLTVRMVARLQSFPDSWEFAGGKTAQYRQVGNAFPPKVAQAVSSAIKRAFRDSSDDDDSDLFCYESRLCEASGNLIVPRGGLVTSIN